MADSCHLDFLKKDQLFSLAILAYHITSLPKAIYEKKSNVIFRRLKSRCVIPKYPHDSPLCIVFSGSKHMGSDVSHIILVM